jgi:hypothetical protein
MRQLAAKNKGRIFVASRRHPLQFIRTHENFSISLGRADGIRRRRYF